VRPWVMAARDAGATVRWVDVRSEDATLDVDFVFSPRHTKTHAHSRIDA